MIKRILAVMVAFVMVLGFMPVPQAQATDLTQASSGTTYYVSSLNGAEGNDGTSENAPFASLLEINKITLQPGDRVLLERGSVFVDEYLHIKGSGNEEAPIIIDVYGDENAPKPLIQTNGNGVWYQDFGKQLDNKNHQNKGNVSSCILLYDVEYIEISNIAMTNEGNFAEGEVYNTARRMDRTGVAGVAENIGTVDHIYLKNLDIRNVQGNVYNKHMCNGGIYFVCHNADDESTGIARYDDILIEGCRLDKVNRWGIAVGYTAYWDGIPYGPTIDAEVCATYGSTNVVIRGNYLTEVGGDGITTMYCAEPLIEYNVVEGYCRDMTSSVYQYPENRGGMVAAGIWPWMCKTPIFQYNECYTSTYNQDGQAWDADWGDNAVYQYNYSCNNAGGAIMFCGTHACNTVFRYNISQDDLSGVLNLAGSPNGEIYNNVFYIKEGVKINRDGMSGGRNNVVSNNIFYYTGSEPASAVYGNWNDIGAQWRNNIYFNYATTPADDYAITADPMFVDPGKGPTGAQENGLVHDISAFEGYMLQEGSPAINAGVPIENSDIYLNSGLDFFGNKLDLIPDIGAYEAGTFEADAERAVIVNVEMGQTTTIIDTVTDFTGLTPVVEDEKISSVVIEGSSQVIRTYGESVKALEDGQYILVNNRAGKTMTNQDASQSADAGAMNGLRLDGTKDNIQDNAIWTITGSGSGYTIQDENGKYLTISANDAAVVDAESVVTAAYNGNWTLSQNGAYLNDAAGKAVCASGWQDPSAATDSGSQWSIYTITDKTFNSTELTFTGLFPGTTNIIIGDTLYLVRVSGLLQEVMLNVGETASFADPSGNYTDADTSSLDPNVVTVKLTGMLTDDYALGSKVTSLTSGGKYLLVNTRSGKPVTNQPTTGSGATGLLLSGSKDDVAKAAIWTITSNNGGYTVQDLDGKYMTVGSSTSSLVDTATTLALNYKNGTWTIAQNGAYLNHFGGSGSTCAAGWQDNAAAGDSGSQWDIYELTAIAGENGTQITFTAVAGGETHVLIGETMYHIVVNGPAHRFENGYCDHCGEYEAAKLVDGVYEIGNAGQLFWFANLVDSGELDADAILTADITMDEEVRWNAIGSNSKKYSGTFDGQEFTISGLYYENDATTGAYIGLIASLDEGGVVKNVTVADSYICGYRYIGAIVGQNNGGIIVNCHNDGSVIMGSGSNVGGIVGGNAGTVTNCSNSGEISADEGNNIGGIAGGNSGIIERCFNTGDVISDCCSDEHCVGGIVGENVSGTIRNCYNAGSVENKGAATGGIAGKADRGTIENCHNVGEVSGKKDTYDIVGKAYNNPTVSNCYYLADAESDQLDGTTAMDAEAFASGKVLELLNGSASEEDAVWKQNIGSDAYPMFNEGACAHVPTEAVKENSVQATCTEDGSYDSVIYCAKCGEEISRETVTVPALGHAEVVIPGTDATCTETGLTEGKKCSVCEEVLVAQEEIPALGHDWKGTSCTRCDATRENPFTDVPADSFYIDPVLWAVEKGITNGMTATTFGPDLTCNRAQVVTFLWRAAGSPAPTKTEHPFTDVEKGAFYYDAMLWAVENGITNGLTATTFGPNETCNRAQVVTFLWRAMNKPQAAETEHPFTDVDATQFYYKAMLWAVEKGITNGLTATTFGPTATCNRAQVVTFLYRTLG